MIYSNEESVKVLKGTIMIAGLSMVVIMAVLIFIQQFLILAILTGFFLLCLIIISILNFQYVYIGENNNKLIVRYYTVFSNNVAIFNISSSVSRDYQSIEIPKEFLRQIRVTKLFFGLKWDLRFTVELRQGLADYPPVSLSAVPLKDREKLISALKHLIPA